jgi:glycosyltransferase involved in cell wall biosynthesis
MTDLEKFKISAVIPAYNCEKYIARSIDSILAQTCPVDEIIVVDDGSQDKTADIVRSYGDKVKLIQQPNAGVSVARNTGILAATGDWIAFLDADDEWLPEKIKRQIEHLQNNPDLVWSMGNYIHCLCEENCRAEHTVVSKCLRYQKNRGYYASYFEAIQLYQWGHMDCLLIQKKIFHHVGVFHRELRIAEDLDIWLRIAYRYPKVGFLPEPLAVHHLSSENSLMKQPRQPGLYADFMTRHLALSQEQGVSELFKPAAAFMMRRWIRGMLFAGQKADIRELLRRFPEFFSAGYRFMIGMLTLFPKITQGGLRIVSNVMRTLNLPRRITRRPGKNT